jgi:hypothetical protein
MNRKIKSLGRKIDSHFTLAMVALIIVFLLFDWLLILGYMSLAK